MVFRFHKVTSITNKLFSSYGSKQLHVIIPRPHHHRSLLSVLLTMSVAATAAAVSSGRNGAYRVLRRSPCFFYNSTVCDFHTLRSQSSDLCHAPRLGSAAHCGVRHPTLSSLVSYSSLTASRNRSTDGVLFQRVTSFSIIRLFTNVSEYHSVADETLEEIQDAIEELFESTDIEVEVSVASGVLTLTLPQHGTWVINKQTPNQQIWWSSPLSGPRRYEYLEESERWAFTRAIDSGDYQQTLGSALVEEIKQLYDLDLDLDV